MKPHFWSLITTGLFLLLAACSAPPVSKTPTAPPTLPPTRQPAATETLAAAPTLSATARPTFTATPAGPTALAEKAVREYFAALQAGDPFKAAALVSNYSLVYDYLTRDDWAGQIQSQMSAGTKWSDLQVKEARVFNDQTVLVHVAYQLETRDAKTGETSQEELDELWPVRFENGQWLYNRANVIDFMTLDVPQQTYAGLLVKPLQLLRYSDHIRLVLLVQNLSSDPIVFGQVNEVMAAFTFRDLKVDAKNKQMIFDTLRSYPDVAIDLDGLYTGYPDGVVLRQWTNFDTPPWFIFHFSQ